MEDCAVPLPNSETGLAEYYFAASEALPNSQKARGRNSW